MNVKSRDSIHRDRVSMTPTPKEDNNQSSEKFSKSMIVKTPKSPTITKEHAHRTPHMQRDETGSKVKYITFLVCVVAGFVAFIYFFESKKCSYGELMLKYPDEDSYLWESLSVGIENIILKQSDKPGVYLFVHNGSVSVKKMIGDIAQESSACFGHKRNPVEMASDEFSSKKAILDYGYVIEKFKIKMKEENVILIANLNQIPAEAARALHVICDTYSPLVKNVLIFLTLVIQGNSGNYIADTENTLTELWGSKLNRSELDPLIARITDHVIQLGKK